MEGPQCEVLLTDSQPCLAKHFSTQPHRKNLQSLRDPNRIRETLPLGENLSPLEAKAKRRAYMKEYMRKQRAHQS